MKKTLTLIALVVSLCLALSVLAAEKSTVTAEAAQKMLQDGNQRFLQAKYENPHRGEARIKEVAKGQKPFAVIVGCSDSRVPPEVVFDQGLGDPFIVRLAGNVVDDAALASIEYAIDHLGVPLIVVLGHERCGAVAAAVEAVDKKAKPHGHLPALVKTLKPAVDETRGQSGNWMDNAVHANIRLVTYKLRASKPVLAPAVKAGKVKVVSAYYDLDDGKVNFIP